MLHICKEGIISKKMSQLSSFMIKSSIDSVSVPPAVNTHVRSRQAFLLEVNQAPNQERAAFLEPETFKMQVLIFYSYCSKIDILEMEPRSNCTNFSPLTQSGH